jgi:hypothetical protein
MTADQLTSATRLKSPTCGGFRGPTPSPPHTHPYTTPLKSPQHWGAGHPPQRVGGLAPHAEKRKRKS